MKSFLACALALALPLSALAQSAPGAGTPTSEEAEAQAEAEAAADIAMKAALEAAQASSEPAVKDAAQAPAQALGPRIDRMTTYLVNMLPMHTIFASVLAEDSLKEELNAKQEACFRKQLTREALVARKRREVEAFAKREPKRFDAGLALLDEGAGEVVTKLGQASFADAAEGSDTVDKIDMASLPPDHLVSFMTFAYASEHRELRALSGYGEFNEEKTQGPSEVERMLDAMSVEIGTACDIPKSFFD
jgi:hypothetical protein